MAGIALSAERQAALWVEYYALRDVANGSERQMSINGKTYNITPEIASWALPIVELIEKASEAAAQGVR